MTWLDYAIVECSELNYPFKFIDWQLKLEDGAEEGDEECLLVRIIRLIDKFYEL
ncbi:unnamed protein product [Anisakis simplex]|uniref:Uncharacterized protein n=1 Tax=Anisakis simplex TaxID=6269 RepID=A0A0M3JNF5_ANISI|nr:unnamed protein product [Anisakis simplex]